MLIGSHLDSVLDGGAYDGPLGVVSSLAAVDLLRARGVVPAPADRDRRLRRGGGLPVRDRLPRLAAGQRGDSPPDAAAELRDRDGVPLLDAMAAAGLAPSLGRASLAGPASARFVELHVEQGRDLVDRDAPVGLATGIWPHGRYRFDFTGDANHAGHHPDGGPARPDAELRRDRAGRELARRASLGQRATFGRLDVAPNGTNAIPSRVTAWLDARCDTEDELVRLVAEIQQPGAERAARDGTRLEVTPESVSGDGRLRPGADRSACGPASPAAGASAGDPDDGRPRRRHPRRGRGPDRDDVRPQPDRRLALARPSTPRRPTASPASRRWPTPSRCWSRDRLPPRARPAGDRRRVRRTPRGGGRVDQHGQGCRAIPTLSGDVSAENARVPRLTGETDAHPGPRASPSPASPTATPTPSTGRCGGTRRPSGGRSGPGGSRCTPSRPSSPRTPTSRSPATPTRRCGPPGSRRSGSSTTCTTSPTGRRTTTPTRWAGRCWPPPTRPGSGSGCSTPATSPPGSAGRPRACRCATPTATPHAWAERVAAFDDPRVGAAIHSVRAVPRDQLPTVVEAAAGDAAARPPLRAGRRERGLPRGHRAAPRPSCSPRPGRSAR